MKHNIRNIVITVLSLTACSIFILGDIILSRLKLTGKLQLTTSETIFCKIIHNFLPVVIILFSILLVLLVVEIIIAGKSAEDSCV